MTAIETGILMIDQTKTLYTDMEKSSALACDRNLSSKADDFKSSIWSSSQWTNYSFFTVEPHSNDANDY